MSAIDRVRELAAAWDEDAISAEEMSELAALLESDADARRVLVEEFMLTGGCAQHSGASEGELGPSRVHGRWRGSERSSPRRLALYAGLAAAAAVVVVAWVASRSPDSGPVARVASVVEGGASVGTGDALASGDRIETGGGSVVFRYGTEATEVSLGPDTVATIDAERPGKCVRLDAGRLVARVSPQPDGKPMVFLTPQAECIVLGTVLSIEADTASTLLEVASGRVRMVRASDGASIEVGPGESARIGADGPIVLEPVEPKRDATAPASSRAVPAFAGHRRILLTEYGSFAQYMLFGSVEGRAAVHDGEKALELIFGAATNDWHGGVWLPAGLPRQLSDARCIAVVFRLAGGGVLPQEAFIGVRVPGGGKYRTDNVAALFADTSWREVVLLSEDLKRDPYWSSQHPGVDLPEHPELSQIDRVEITCVSPPMRAAVPARIGSFRMIVRQGD